MKKSSAATLTPADITSISAGGIGEHFTVYVDCGPRFGEFSLKGLNAARACLFLFGAALSDDDGKEWCRLYLNNASTYVLVKFDHGRIVFNDGALVCSAPFLAENISRILKIYFPLVVRVSEFEYKASLCTLVEYRGVALKRRGK